MSERKERQPLNTEEILPQMMEELMKVKAEKNALVSLIGFLLKKIQLPQGEQQQFFDTYIELATEEFTRLIADHPWFEQYWQERHRDTSGSDGMGD